MMMGLVFSLDFISFTYWTIEEKIASEITQHSRISSKMMTPCARFLPRFLKYEERTGGKSFYQRVSWPRYLVPALQKLWIILFQEENGAVKREETSHRGVGSLLQRVWKKVAPTSTTLEYKVFIPPTFQRVLNDLKRTRLSRRRMIRLPTLHSPPLQSASCPLFLSLPVCCRWSLLTGDEGGGGGGAK